MMRRSRGFTLIEMATALAVSLVVVYAAVASVMAMQRSLSSARQAAEVDGDAKVVIEHLVRRLQGIGGYGIPIEGALDVEPAGCAPRSGLPGCGDHDRYSIIEVDDDRPVLTLTGVTASSVSAPLTCGSGGTACCLQTLPGVNDAFTLQYRQGYILGDDGSRRLVFFTNNPNVSTCSIPISTSPTYPAAFEHNDVLAAGAWTMVPVEVTTFYVDDNDNALKAFHDWALDGLLDDDDVDVLAVNIYDLQIAVGFDPNGDGVATNTASTTDEWLGNALGDALGSDGLSAAMAADLRLAKVAIVVGVSSPYLETRGLSILDGPTIAPPRMTLRSSVGQALFRNLDLFY